MNNITHCFNCNHQLQPIKTFNDKEINATYNLKECKNCEHQTIDSGYFIFILLDKMPTLEFIYIKAAEILTIYYKNRLIKHESISQIQIKAYELSKTRIKSIVKTLIL